MSLTNAHFSLLVAQNHSKDLNGLLGLTEPGIESAHWGSLGMELLRFMRSIKELFWAHSGFLCLNGLIRILCGLTKMLMQMALWFERVQ